MMHEWCQNSTSHPDDLVHILRPEALTFQLADEPLTEKLRLLKDGAFRNHATAALVWLLLHTNSGIEELVRAANHLGMTYSNIMTHLLRIGFTREEVVVILCTLPQFTSRQAETITKSLSLPMSHYNELIVQTKAKISAQKLKASLVKPRS